MEAQRFKCDGYSHARSLPQEAQLQCWSSQRDFFKLIFSKMQVFAIV